MISFHDRPAKKMTHRPAESTRIAVPRSGCLTMKPTGTSSSRPAIRKSSTRSWPSRRWNHQASISGMAIFMISLGWIVMPTLSQRVAPLRVMPMPGSAVASSSSRPAR